MTDKVDLFRFKEKHTPQTACGPLQRASLTTSKCGMVNFYGLGNFRLMSGRIIPITLSKGWRFPRVGPLPIFGLLMVS